MHHFLDFEKAVAELEGKISELRHLSSSDGVNIVEEIKRLQEKSTILLTKLYANLTPWQKVQVARHPDRPHCLDYINRLITDFIPLAGDRNFAEDEAIIGGMGRFRGQSVMIIGQEKGHDTDSRIKHNFGSPKPEGYRKARRLMELAEQYNLPVITLVDTAGAYPGIEAEERGQAEAIARSIQTCLSLTVPIVTAIIGEGGSGGAIAIATANRVLMLEHSIYSVISPEGCASILWRDANKKETAAEAQQLTAQDLINHKIIDEIVTEPIGGAHRNKEATIQLLGDAIERHLHELARLGPHPLKEDRKNKYLEMGRQYIS